MAASEAHNLKIGGFESRDRNMYECLKRDPCNPVEDSRNRDNFPEPVGLRTWGAVAPDRK